jgi:hypothetical protein
MFYSTSEAVRYLEEKHGIKRSIRTLQTMRRFGGGPIYRKPNASSCLYKDSDLDQWVEQITEKQYEHTAQDTIERLNAGEG